MCTHAAGLLDENILMSDESSSILLSSPPNNTVLLPLFSYSQLSIIQHGLTTLEIGLVEDEFYLDLLLASPLCNITLVKRSRCYS